MCYGIPADAEKDVSKYRSSEKESEFTPRKSDMEEMEIQFTMSQPGFAAMFHELLAPFSNEKGGTWHIEEIDTSVSDDKRKVEKVS